MTARDPHRFSSPGNGSMLYITDVSLLDNGTFTCEFISIKTVYSSILVLGEEIQYYNPVF